MDYDKLIEKSLEKIEQSISDKVDIRALADLSCFSKYYFQRLFHAYAGSSVMDYVKKRRLSIAGRELCETDGTVIDIALRCGYSSPESFARAFKAYHGITPTECRRYRIYLSFEKGLKGVSNTMKATHENLSKRTEEILKEYHDLVAACGETARKVETAAAEIHQPQFSVVAQEFSMLSGRMKETCEDISGVMGRGLPGHFERVNQRFALIKMIEDLTFQTHILSFFSGLRAAGCEAAQPIATACKCLADQAAGKAKKAVTIFDALADDIHEDIGQQLSQALRRMGSTAAGAADTISTARQGLEKAGDGSCASFCAVKGMLKKTEGTIRDASKRLCGADAAPKDSIRTARMIPSIIEDNMFMANILAFGCKMDAAVSGTENAQAFSNTVLALPQTIAPYLKDSQEQLETLEQLYTLYQENPDAQVSAGKAARDILSQCCVLYYALESEILRFRAKTSSPAADTLHTAARQMAEALEAFRDNAAQGFQPARKALCGQLQTVCSSIGKEGGNPAQDGAPFSYLADEISAMIKKIDALQ